MKQFKTVDDYMAAIEPAAARASLTRLREIIREEAPEAEESISYGMPAYKLNGPVVYFGVFKNHCSLFGTSTTSEDFADELSGYKTSKGTIQFPHDVLLPEPLIRKIVRRRIEINLAKKKR